MEQPSQAWFTLVVHGYNPATYGDRFADVYDDWYPEHDTTPATLAALAGMVTPSSRILELGVGTGRLAIPLAGAGHEVWGIDASAAMLVQLAGKPGGAAVRGVVGDMGADLPDGPFDLVYVASNTFFGLPSADAQRRAMAAIAERLTSAGRFVVAAFVPADDAEIDAAEIDDAGLDRYPAAGGAGDGGAGPVRGSERVEVRSMTADVLVLSVSRTDPIGRRAEGHHVELRHGLPVVLRPWSIRYSTPAELDRFAADAGLAVEHRWSDWSGSRFTDTSSHHVTTYRRGT